MIILKHKVSQTSESILAHASDMWALMSKINLYYYSERLI